MGRMSLILRIGRLGLIVLCMMTGCSSRQPVVVLGGQEVSAERIDADPFALLPGEAIVVGSLDARSMFRSSAGGPMAKLVESILPLGGESDFVPSRDVHRIHGALYAMQGADFCAVLQGNFQTGAIRAAARQRSLTPGGVPLVRTDYAGVEMYTVSNVGFVVLTKHTILTGNETGMRRALDRLRYGRFENRLAPWARVILEDGVLRSDQAAFGVVGEFAGRPTVAALSAQLPFLKGMKVLRVLGNFRPPGVNVVGTLGYDNEEGAKGGKAGLAQVQQLAFFASFFATLGFGGAMPTLETQLRGNEVAFATKIDTQTINMLLSMLAQAAQPRR